MIALKNSVRLPHSARIIVGVSNALETLGVRQTRVIGANDSAHDPDGPYYRDEAVDFALAGLSTEMVLKVIRGVKDRLGDAYEMTVEPRDHQLVLCVEYRK